MEIAILAHDRDPNSLIKRAAQLSIRHYRPYSV